MSEEQVKSVFDLLEVGTEEDRNALQFKSPDFGANTSVELKIVTHTGPQSELQPLLHA